MKNLSFFILLFLITRISFSQELVATITSSPTSIAGTRFGNDIDITKDGDYLVVSQYLYDIPVEQENNNQGRIQIFKRNGDNWDLILSDTPSPTLSDKFGEKVAIAKHNNYVFVAASSQQISASGSGYVALYAYNTDTNSFQSVGFDLDNDGNINNGEGFILNGDGSGDYFGRDLAFSGDGSVLAISATGYEPPGGSNKGHVRVFKFQDDINRTWRSINTIDEIIGSNSSYFGQGVALDYDGSRLLVTSTSKGYFEVYNYDNPGWSVVGTTSSTYNHYDLDGNGNADNMYYGSSADISADGNRVVIGIPFWDKVGNENSGAVKVYNYDANQASKWVESSLIEGRMVDKDFFGYSVDLNNDGNLLLVTGDGTDNKAIFETSDGTNWNAKNLNFNISTDIQIGKISDPYVAFGIWRNGTNFAGDVKVFTYNTSPTVTLTSSHAKVNNYITPTLTFTLSASSTTFTADDITLSSGSIGALTATSSRVYTATYTPASNTVTTVSVSVATASFTDMVGNTNTASSTTFDVDTVSPTLSSFTHNHNDQVVKGGETVILTATFSENMTSSPTIKIRSSQVIEVNDVLMTATSSSVWTYSWVVSNTTNGDLAATVSGTDLFGNYYAGTESLTFRIDNVSPTLTITKPDGTYSNQSVVVTLTYDEAVTGLTTDTNDFSEAINVSSLTLLSASDDGTTYTILITPTGDGLVKLTHAPGSPPVRDIAGNTISSTVSCSFIYDGSPPTINQITSPMADGTYTDYDGNTALSDTVTITVSFTESVTITGTPRVVLNTTPVTYANYHEGTGTATITFSATVSQEILQLALDVTALELNGGTITDLATNTASLTLAYVTSNSKNLDDLKNIKLDSKNPVLSNFAVTENNNLAPVATTSVKDGDQVTYGFQSDKELLLSSLTVTFTGFTPTLTTITNGIGPYSYQFSFTVSNTFPEGAVALQFSATDKVTTTLVPIGNPTGILTQAAFTDIIVIDRTAPRITSNANLTSDENSTIGPTITASENVFYSLIGGADQALLTINQNTGVLTFNTAPDFEAPIDAGADNTYEIIVKAIDWVGLTVTQTVNIQINDLNDTFGVLVTPTDVQTTESGETASIDFILITQPTANVTIRLSLSDTTEGSLSATQITFTPENWNTAQTVSISGVDDRLADGDITYQLITANTTSNDTTYNGLVVDDVTLTNIDNEIDIDGDGFFDYQDAFPNDPTEWLDTDNDGIGNNTDLDDDGDDISDEYEIQLGTDPLDPNDTPSDFNLNGIPNLIDPDDDGDGYEDEEDAFPLDGTEHEDTDSDGIGNNADTDDDGDGILDVAEDEFITIRQVYKIEVQGSYKSNLVPIPKIPIERKNVGKWKIRKRISGGADQDKFIIKSGEPASPSQNSQQKAEESNGYLAFITPPDINNPIDHNRDNVYEVELSYINTIGGDKRVPDPENKGEIKVNSFVLNVFELTTNPIPLEEAEGFEITSDLDADSINNSLDSDDDGDGILTLFEKGNVLLSEEDVLLDTDEDGYVDFQDPDDDNDGIFTQFEQSDPDGNGVPNDAVDLDQDGIKNYLDSDDDGDGILTFYENSDPNDDGNPSDAIDFDGDGIADYLDVDDDNDGLLTLEEGLKDTDGDGNPDYHDSDDDNDGVATLFELSLSGVPLDTDNDGIIDSIDSDDDGDGLLTILEDLNGNRDPRDDDTDSDGIPNYLESRSLDRDDDGVADEFDSVDDNPYNDQDGDGYPNMDEKLAGTNPLDPNSFPNGFFGALRASIDIVSFFSPNSDGINDTWQVKEIDRYPNNQVWIFTRTGYEVFNTQNYRNDWSGTQNGNPLPEGSYYYRIDLDGNSTVDFEGWLYLTR